MKNHEKFNSEESPQEFIESLRETPAGKYMEGEPMPDAETLKEKAPTTNSDIEKEMSGEMCRVAWENRLNGNSGHSEYMPREKAEKWLQMVREKYPDEEFWRHWIETEKEDSNQKK
ncbi:MAG: hypothetical protein WDZ40_00800 [Candidatus Spechtbacterales bacterium]